MAVELQIPSLRIQVKERIRLQQLLALRETRVHSLAVLELDQQRRRAFVDQHRGRNEKLFVVGKVVLAFQMRMGKIPENSVSVGPVRIG